MTILALAQLAPMSRCPLRPQPHSELLLHLPSSPFSALPTRPPQQADQSIPLSLLSLPPILLPALPPLSSLYSSSLPLPPLLHSLTPLPNDPISAAIPPPPPLIIRPRLTTAVSREPTPARKRNARLHRRTVPRLSVRPPPCRPLPTSPPPHLNANAPRTHPRKTPRCPPALKLCCRLRHPPLSPLPTPSQQTPYAQLPRHLSTHRPIRYPPTPIRA